MFDRAGCPHRAVGHVLHAGPGDPERRTELGHRRVDVEDPHAGVEDPGEVEHPSHRKLEPNSRKHAAASHLLGSHHDLRCHHLRPSRHVRSTPDGRRAAPGVGPRVEFPFATSTGLADKVCRRTSYAIPRRLLRGGERARRRCSTGGHPQPEPAAPPRARALATVFAVRAAFGFAGRTDLIVPGSSSPAFRRNDRRVFLADLSRAGVGRRHRRSCQRVTARGGRGRCGVSTHGGDGGACDSPSPRRHNARPGRGCSTCGACADGLPVFESGWTFDHLYPLAGDSTDDCLEGWITLTAARCRRRPGCAVASS